MDDAHEAPRLVVHHAERSGVERSAEGAACGKPRLVSGQALGDVAVFEQLECLHRHGDEWQERVLGRPASSIRVIAPDVGGGFGAKGGMYPDELLVVRPEGEAPIAMIRGKPAFVGDTVVNRFIRTTLIFDGPSIPFAEFP